MKYQKYESDVRKKGTVKIKHESELMQIPINTGNNNNIIISDTNIASLASDSLHDINRTHEGGNDQDYSADDNNNNNNEHYFPSPGPGHRQFHDRWIIIFWILKLIIILTCLFVFIVCS